MTSLALFESSLKERTSIMLMLTDQLGLAPLTTLILGVSDIETQLLEFRLSETNEAV